MPQSTDHGGRTAPRKRHYCLLVIKPTPWNQEFINDVIQRVAIPSRSYFQPCSHVQT